VWMIRHLDILQGLLDRYLDENPDSTTHRYGPGTAWRPMPGRMRGSGRSSSYCRRCSPSRCCP
jgi:hypothetical protein